jgi:branched-chain amino acid transport system ATP-binding protein
MSAPEPTRSAPALLSVEGVAAGYRTLQVLSGVSLELHDGELVALLGPNGAGKSTTLRVITGLVPASAGAVRLEGEEITGLAPDRISRKGIAFVTETSNLFLTMTVEENLRLGGSGSRDRSGARARLELVEELFPALRERRRQPAGTLSGGERRMLGIGRGLMSGPRLLMIDEPSLGLAPRAAELLFESLARLNRDGLAILLVEQNVHASLEVAARGYVLEQGRVVLAGTSRELLASPHVRASYLGVAREEQ